VSQRTSSPCGLFSRAEDKLKLSDDVIEEAFRTWRQFVHLYFTRFALLWAFFRLNRRFQFQKRGQLSLACITKRFLSARCASAIQIIRPFAKLPWGFAVFSASVFRPVTTLL
jgi:hypothetical protein